jgi:hypothetical protein
LKLLLDAGANFEIVDQGRAVIKGISESNKNFTTTASGMNGTEEIEEPVTDDQMDEDYQEEMYDHLDVLSWVLYPTKMGKEVRETVHALRSAGIRLRFDGISKYSFGRTSRTKWLKDMDPWSQLKLFQTAGLFDHLDDTEMVKKGSISAVGWNVEEVQAELGVLEMTRSEMETAFMNHGYEDYVEPTNTIWYGNAAQPARRSRTNG